MRRYHVFPFLSIVLLVSLMMATGSLVAAENDMYTVRVPLKGRPLLESLAERNIEVLTLNRDGTIDVAARESQLDFLFSLGYPVSVIETPDMINPISTLSHGLGLYHTYAEMESVLTDLTTTYPTLTEQTVIGTSIEGRNIYVLKISDNAIVDESEPEVLIMANHHSREIMTVEIALKFAIHLLENYGMDATVTNMVNEREIFIAPMINPDGHVYVENNHGGSPGSWWRKNRRLNPMGSYGVDLNRNYGFAWGYDDIGSSPVETSIVYRGTGPFSEPETQAVRDFCESREFTMAFSYHSYGELLLYPWGYYYGYTPHHDVFLALGDTLTDTNGYFPGNAAMGAIYIVNGDTDDWAYGEQGTKDLIFSFTPEVNSFAQGGFGPDESWIQPTFDLLLPMNMLFLQLGDNPYRVVAPYRPTMFAVQDPYPPNYTLSWSANDPGDPNPVVDYDVIEYDNYHTLAQDGANGNSPLWIFGGFTPSGARAFEGSGSYYSGAVDNTSSTLTAATFYRVEAGTEVFTSQVWYNIETHWDYAYLQVSTDGGMIWETVQGNLTTNTNPNGNNLGNGVTGSSPGWVPAIFDLTAYMDQDILLRWNYVTDASVLNEGIYVDIPGPVPTYDSKATIASMTPEPWLFVTPTATGDFTYVVRARDAEGHLTPWSNSVDHTVTVVSAVGDTPAFASGMEPNYPNPFNPSTHIPYTVGDANGDARAVSVSLTIHDVAGKRVATLFQGSVPPGHYQAVWDGRSDMGAWATSGVYFARLALGGQETFMHKLVLLK